MFIRILLISIQLDISFGTESSLGIFGATNAHKVAAASLQTRGISIPSLVSSNSMSSMANLLFEFALLIVAEYGSSFLSLTALSELLLGVKFVFLFLSFVRSFCESDNLVAAFSLELVLLIAAVVVDVVLHVALVNVIVVVIMLRLTDSVHEKR